MLRPETIKDLVCRLSRLFFQVIGQNRIPEYLFIRLTIHSIWCEDQVKNDNIQSNFQNNYSWSEKGDSILRIKCAVYPLSLIQV